LRHDQKGLLYHLPTAKPYTISVSAPCQAHLRSHRNVLIMD
jgi:hypothetical protein